MSRDAAMTASDPDVSAWVAAHAGAGKTYTLANRVARLLLAGTRPEKILCLTFTKAAAAEMQDRLFKQLGEWAMLPDEVLRARIGGIGGEAHGDLATARRLFAAALETPGGLKVLTLHAFCQIVLSRFPLEAGVPPAFDVLDEQSSREMIAQARQRILERAGGGEAHMAAAVSYLVTESGEFRLTQILDAALGGDRRTLDRLLADGAPPSSIARTAHGVGPNDTAESVGRDFCAELKREKTLLAALPGWYAGGTAAEQLTAQGWSQYLSTKFGADGFPLLQELLLTQKLEPRKKPATKKLSDARPDLLAFITDLQSRFCDALNRRRAARGAQLTEAALTLIAAVRREYDDAKRLRGTLDYDDLVARTSDLLNKTGAAQWVLYKLDGGIDHLLIDEAQDTSPQQWDIVRKLTEEFFAGAGARAGQRTIFAVGDEKQSIFSFQGADPSQFELNRRFFEVRLADAGQTLRNQPLVTSRRSAPDVLRFVDEVFAPEAARAGLTYDGGAIAHQAHRATAKGGIEFWPALTPADADEIDPWLPVDAVQVESPVARLAQQVAERIAHWLRDGARLPDHAAPIRPRDIMILLPRRNPFGGEVIRQLKLKRVPVAGADRVRLTDQIAVMDLIALGRFVLQQQDDLNLAALLRSPLCGLSEDALFDLAHDRKTDLWSTLVTRQSKYREAHDFLAAMLDRADFAPPFEFYAHALTRLGGRERLLARLGMESADAVAEFLSATLTHEQSHSPSLESFLDWIGRGGTEIKRDMERGRDEVRVMTVHGAKGLEADIVILPDTTAQPGGLSRHEGLLYTEDGGALFPLPTKEAPQVTQAAKAAADAQALNEHRRLLYVALTRARDRLYVCGYQGKRGAHPQSWYTLTEAAARQIGVSVKRGDGEILTVGTVSEDKVSKTADEKVVAEMPDWLLRAAPREPVVPNPIRPSEVGGGTAAFSPLANGARRFLRGTVVHALLARLPEIPRERRQSIALKFVAKNGFDAASAQALVEETLAVLDDPQFAAAFAPDSRAEVAIRASRPDLGLKAPIEGRLDRLAVTVDEVLIVDFKTNRPAPVRERDVAAVTLAQMALYRAAAQGVFPNRRIVCGLVFTDGPRLVRLSEVLLDTHLADIAARLDPAGGRS